MEKIRGASSKKGLTPRLQKKQTVTQKQNIYYKKKDLYFRSFMAPAKTSANDTPYSCKKKNHPSVMSFDCSKNNAAVFHLLK